MFNLIFKLFKLFLFAQGQIFVHLTETGELCFKIPIKQETNVKDITNIVSVTAKPYFVALLEGERYLRRLTFHRYIINLKVTTENLFLIQGNFV